MAKTRISSFRTNRAFQKRWIINSMINFKEVLNTPNILQEKQGGFQGIPALLVAAGPSLDDEIENIRHIKENGLAYIFSVGSSINTLLHNGIKPDAACTYDPTKENSIVFEKVVAEGIDDIPLIFGSSVGFETLQYYPGSKLHMITSQDTIASFFLKLRSGEQLYTVTDAPSIAIVTLQLLYQLGFSPIILVGQNLAYRGESNYASGIDYRRGMDDKEKSLVTKDVNGNDIFTNEMFNRMRISMEFAISTMSGIKVINATKGGAHIEGTQFMSLEQVIQSELKKVVVSPTMFSSLTTDYDINYLLEQFRVMTSEFDRLPLLFGEVRRILQEIQSLIRNQNYPQIETMYRKLDIAFSKIKDNEFYQWVILPMNRVEKELLTNEIG